MYHRTLDDPITGRGQVNEVETFEREHRELESSRRISSLGSPSKVLVRGISAFVLK